MKKRVLALLLCLCMALVTGCQSGGTYDDFYGDFQTSTGDNSTTTSSEGAGDTTTDVPSSTTEGTKNSVATTDPTTTKKPTASTKKPTTTTSQKPLLDPSVVTATNTNLAKGKAVTESGKKIAAFTDGDTTTAAFSGANGQNAAFELDLGKQCTFNEIWLYESGGKKVKEFSIYIQKGSKWELIYKQDEIGSCRICSFPAVTAQKVKIEVTATRAAYTLCEIGVVNAASREDKNDFRVFSYFTGWAEFAIYGSEDMPEFFKDSTDLIYIGDVCWDANSNINFNRGNGSTLSTEAEYAEKVANTKACIKATGKDIRLWATVGNPSGTDTMKTFEGEAKTKLIGNLIAFAKKYGFAGLDFDWEYPSGAAQWAAYSSFLVDLKKEMNKHGLLLSTAQLPGAVHLSSEAIASIDYVQTMVYDLVDGDTGNHASYNKAVTTIKEFLNLGFKREQINLGLAFYGKSGLNQNGYKGIVRRGVTRWDNTVGKVHFNGPQMIRDKTVLAIQEELAGVMVWHMMCDTEKSVYGVSLYDEVTQVREQYLH